MSEDVQAEEFSDLCGEILHGARLARATSIFLALVVVVLLIVVFVQASRPMPAPLVVRVDQVGRAEVVAYDMETATPDESDPVVPYFLNTFVMDHYGRRHGLGAERWQLSHHFLTEELSLEAYNRDRDELTTFVASAGDATEQHVENIIVRIIPQPEPPYRAEVLFDRVERYFDSELSRVAYTLGVQFVFAESVPPESLLINPLGIVITYLQAEQAIVAAEVG